MHLSVAKSDSATRWNISREGMDLLEPNLQVELFGCVANSGTRNCLVRARSSPLLLEDSASLGLGERHPHHLSGGQIGADLLGRSLPLGAIQQL